MEQMTLAKRYIGTAETFLAKADREWAYYKNNAYGDPKTHYLNSQKAYAKAREFAEKARNVLTSNGIRDADIERRVNVVLEKVNRNK